MYWYLFLNKVLVGLLCLAGIALTAAAIWVYVATKRKSWYVSGGIIFLMVRAATVIPLLIIGVVLFSATRDVESGKILTQDFLKVTKTVFNCRTKRKSGKICRRL